MLPLILLLWVCRFKPSYCADHSRVSALICSVSQFHHRNITVRIKSVRVCCVGLVRGFSRFKLVKQLILTRSDHLII